eukprot:jgi/Mesen1/3336/ME000191S02475
MNKNKLTVKKLGRGAPTRNPAPLLRAKETPANGRNGTTSLGGDAGKVAESYELSPPADGGPPAYAMTIKLGSNLMEVMVKAIEDGIIPYIKLGDSPNSRVIKVGEMEFKFMSIPEKKQDEASLCDCYMERKINGESVLSHVGRVERKLSVQQLLDQSQAAKWKQRSKQTDKATQGRRVKVVDMKAPVDVDGGDVRRGGTAAAFNATRKRKLLPTAPAGPSPSRPRLGPAAAAAAAPAPVRPSPVSRIPTTPPGQSGLGPHLRLCLFNLLKESPKGLKTVTIEQRLQMKKRQFDSVLQQMARFRAPGYWELDPSKVGDGLKTPSLHGSSPDSVVESPPLLAESPAVQAATPPEHPAEAASAPLAPEESPDVARGRLAAAPPAPAVKPRGRQADGLLGRSPGALRHGGGWPRGEYSGRPAPTNERTPPRSGINANATLASARPGTEAYRVMEESPHVRTAGAGGEGSGQGRGGGNAREVAGKGDEPGQGGRPHSNGHGGHHGHPKLSRSSSKKHRGDAEAARSQHQPQVAHPGSNVTSLSKVLQQKSEGESADSESESGSDSGSESSSDEEEEEDAEIDIDSNDEEGTGGAAGKVPKVKDGLEGKEGKESMEVLPRQDSRSGRKDKEKQKLEIRHGGEGVKGDRHPEVRDEGKEEKEEKEKEKHEGRHHEKDREGGRAEGKVHKLAKEGREGAGGGEKLAEKGARPRHRDREARGRDQRAGVLSPPLGSPQVEQPSEKESGTKDWEGGQEQDLDRGTASGGGSLGKAAETTGLGSRKGGAHGGHVASLGKERAGSERGPEEEEADAEEKQAQAGQQEEKGVLPGADKEGEQRDEEKEEGEMEEGELLSSPEHEDPETGRVQTGTLKNGPDQEAPSASSRKPLAKGGAVGVARRKAAEASAAASAASTGPDPSSQEGVEGKHENGKGGAWQRPAPAEKASEKKAEAEAEADADGTSKKAAADRAEPRRAPPAEEGAAEQAAKQRHLEEAERGREFKKVLEKPGTLSKSDGLLLPGAKESVEGKQRDQGQRREGGADKKLRLGESSGHEEGTGLVGGSQKEALALKKEEDSGSDSAGGGSHGSGGSISGGAGGAGREQRLDAPKGTKSGAKGRGERSRAAVAAAASPEVIRESGREKKEKAAAASQKLPGAAAEKVDEGKGRAILPGTLAATATATATATKERPFGASAPLHEDKEKKTGGASSGSPDNADLGKDRRAQKRASPPGEPEREEAKRKRLGKGAGLPKEKSLNLPQGDGAGGGNKAGLKPPLPAAADKKPGSSKPEKSSKLPPIVAIPGLLVKKNLEANALGKSYEGTASASAPLPRAKGAQPAEDGKKGALREKEKEKEQGRHVSAQGKPNMPGSSPLVSAKNPSLPDQKDAERAQVAGRKSADPAPAQASRKHAAPEGGKTSTPGSDTRAQVGAQPASRAPQESPPLQGTGKTSSSPDADSPPAVAPPPHEGHKRTSMLPKASRGAAGAGTGAGAGNGGGPGAGEKEKESGARVARPGQTVERAGKASGGAQGGELARGTAAEARKGTRAGVGAGAEALPGGGAAESRAKEANEKSAEKDAHAPAANGTSSGQKRKSMSATAAPPTAAGAAAPTAAAAAGPLNWGSAGVAKKARALPPASQAQAQAKSEDFWAKYEKERPEPQGSISSYSQCVVFAPSLSPQLCNPLPVPSPSPLLQPSLPASQFLPSLASPQPSPSPPSPVLPP